MAGDLAKTKRLSHVVSEGDAHEAIRKAASRSGKANVDRRKRIIVRPAGSIHRLIITTEVESSRDHTSTLSISGKIGVAPGWILIWIVFVLMMAMTVIGLVIAFITSRSSIKKAERCFQTITTNALELLD